MLTSRTATFDDRSSGKYSPQVQRIRSYNGDGGRAGRSLVWPSQDGWTGGKSGHRPESSGNLHPPNRGCKVRATRLVTPGERFGWRGFRLALAGSLTESATENVPPAERHGGIAQENLRDVFEQLVALVRVKRWGKSPPLGWQHTRHGKPRVVQGQIGGESRPGSSSQRSRGSASRRLLRRMRSLCNGASRCGEQPSGRLLESRREP